VEMAFICVVVMLFVMVLVWEADSGLRGRVLRPAGLLRWLIAGNWTAKLGGLLVSLGSGALLRYLMLHFNLPAHVKIMSGVVIAAALGTGSAMLSARPNRRAVSLALAGASLGVAYLTAYSAYGLFHFVADLQALALLFLVASVATVVAITRRALSIAVLAMAGAYVAPAFALEIPTPLSVYGYYILASVVTLIMVWQRGWRPLIHLSFLFTLAGALFFCWTQRFYTPGYYQQMQPLLLTLVALHLAMPLLESPRGADTGRWARSFDEGYFYLLPFVAATLTLTLAPRLQREGAAGVLALALLWLLTGVWQYVRQPSGALRYLCVAAVFLLMAGLIATTQVPVFLVAAVVTCLLLWASSRLDMSPGAEVLLIALALTASALHATKAVFDPFSGVVFWNLSLARQVLLGIALLVAGQSLRRREQAMASTFLTFGATWLTIAIGRELFRLQIESVLQVAYLAVLVAIGVYVGIVRLRSIVPSQLAVALFGLALLTTGQSSASVFALGLQIPLMLAGQVIYAALALQCDRDNDAESVGAIARSALPLLMLPWAVALNSKLHAPQLDVVGTLLVSSALFASLQAQWLVRKARVWPNRLSPVGFVVVGALLFYETLFHIEREAWAVAFELVALIYLVVTARFVLFSDSRDVPLAGYVPLGAAVTVSAAMLLRLIGPPGTLTILALNDMLLPAVVSLIWAVIGGLLTWLSTRNRSRTLWSLGAMLLIAAAVKLILLDFGSLGQLGNILAMMAAGGVFLLVAWLAPFPPREEGDSESGLRGAPRGTVDSHNGGSGRSWILGLCALAVFALVAKSFAGHARGADVVAEPVEVSKTTALNARDGVCEEFARRLPRDYVVYGVGNPGTSAGMQSDMLARVPLDVGANGGARNIVVAVGTDGPPVWRVNQSDADHIVGVILSGVRHSEITGLASSVPVLHAAYEDQVPCGYFQINSTTPQGASRFISELLAHPVAS
jgi:hypothetical protein